MVNYKALNRNLLEVEQIILSKYGFQFVDLENEKTSSADLMISILQARIITEGICRYIVLAARLVNDEKNIRTATLKVYIDDILRPSYRVVPSPILSCMSTIQEKSNMAVHYQVDGGLDLKHAVICIQSLEEVISWFIKENGRSGYGFRKFRLHSEMLDKGWGVPPKAEGCIISRGKEIGKLYEKVIASKVVYVRGITGVGKTEMIKDYVKKYEKKYVKVFYTEKVDEVDDFLYELPIAIIDEEKKTKTEVMQEKLNEMHSMKEKNLFILDNYTGDKNDVNRIYPVEGDKYHLIILVADQYGVDDEECCDISPFSPDDSLKIFRYFCEEKYEDDKVRNLLSYLAYNPRAIRMSAVYLRDSELYDPEGFINSMKKTPSIVGIMENLYTALSESSVLNDGKSRRFIASCLSLIPYNGMPTRRFRELLCNSGVSEINNENIEETLNVLESAGWMCIDDRDTISMNPLLSDTIFEKTRPDMTSENVVQFITPILEPTKESRELLLTQLFALEPFVDHLLKRILSTESCDLSVLNYVREYYIAVYNIPKIDTVSQLMEREFSRVNLDKLNYVENTIFRQGISRFNLEDFGEAHKYFKRALDMLEKKRNSIDKEIAKISAYEGSSLASIGMQKDALEMVNRSVYIRKELADKGDETENKNLWISHYNYARVLLTSKRYEDARKEIDVATDIYKTFNHEIYAQWGHTDVSSLFQLNGRIYAGLGEYDKAIRLLEDAKTIRKKLKGENFFSTAQIYSYLVEVYNACGKFKNALDYARKYHDVLLLQYRTEDIKKKMEETECKIRLLEEHTKNDQL